MTDTKKPVEPAGLNGLSEVLRGGALLHSPNPAPIQSQAQWEAAREFERQSQVRSRDALKQRGADRFVQIALASTYALAARDAVAGEVRR